jgi:hypothetical protein
MAARERCLGDDNGVAFYYRLDRSYNEPGIHETVSNDLPFSRVFV